MKNAKRARYGSGSLLQRGRVWHVRWREAKHSPDGTTEYVQHMESSGSEDREQAQKFLNRKLREVGVPRQQTTDPKTLCYEDLRDEFLKELREGGSRSLRKGTLSNLGRVDRYFANWRVADFTVKALKTFREVCRKDGVTDATCNRMIAALRRMFRLAIENEWLQASEVPAYFPTVGEGHKAKGAVYITDEWYKLLSKKLPEPLRSAFVLCYHTGIRVGEMEKLRWADVDFAAHSIVLPAEITKTGEPRRIFIPDDFKLTPGKADELVFPLSNAREVWQRVCVQLEIGKWRCLLCGSICDGLECPEHGTRTTKQVSYSGPYLKHTRHSAVRNLAKLGLPERRIMDITGHETRSTFDRYNVSQDTDVESVRLAAKQAHKQRQARLK